MNPVGPSEECDKWGRKISWKLLLEGKHTVIDFILSHKESESHPLMPCEDPWKKILLLQPSSEENVAWICEEKPWIKDKHGHIISFPTFWNLFIQELRDFFSF